MALEIVAYINDFVAYKMMFFFSKIVIFAIHYLL